MPATNNMICILQKYKSAIVAFEVPLRSLLPVSAPILRLLGVLAANSEQLHPSAENCPQQMKATFPGNI